MASAKTTSAVTVREGRGLKSEAKLAKVRSTLKAFEQATVDEAIAQGFESVEDTMIVQEYLSTTQKQLDAYWKKQGKKSK